MKSTTWLFIFTLFLCHFSQAQKLQISDPYLQIKADGASPLYTTYAAAMERSRMYGDKAYKMDYYSDCSPLSYSNDQAGRMFVIWKVDQVVIDKISEYYSRPVVTVSFPDMAIIEYQPFKGISVQETFLVYSSKISIVSMIVTNNSGIDHAVEVYPVLDFGRDSLIIKSWDKQHQAYIMEHKESLKRLISNLKAEYGYPTDWTDYFTCNQPVYSYGAYHGNMKDFYNFIKTDFYSANRNDSLNRKINTNATFAALHIKIRLKPGETTNIRYIRGAQGIDEPLSELVKTADQLKTISLQSFADADVQLFSKIPHISFSTENEHLVYLSSFNLVRGCMLPPSGKTTHNFYVFSREPLWGWGHGHQVLHESLSMLAYSYLDPKSAEESQRVYMEQQGKDGFIAYRHGPRGVQDYPHNGKPTTSAPFFSWINLEVFKAGKDTAFLKEAYASGTKYVDWLFKNRDTNKDGTFEWGPYGIIENVRDWYNAVFQVSAERHLDVDKEDISDELECLDLTLMVIKEMRSLSEMADILGLKKDALNWKKKVDKTCELVNKRMWDEETQFYYSVNKKDYTFKFMTRDLRRKEIIGFLALWAGAAPKDRADKLVACLTDTAQFWRTYGVPTLSAKDDWYSPYVDYCCKWNGPVWLLWDYMVYDGLKSYGYNKEAHVLAQKMMLAVTTQLSKNHNMWESFSPDNSVLNCPSNYIWDSIMAKLLIEEYK
ncbi:MAG: trehalase family glycosidase [Bacteroidia bacterium]|nr:trehalase family glycosidase [Bacteroidia bacterium]